MHGCVVCRGLPNRLRELHDSLMGDAATIVNAGVDHSFKVMESYPVQVHESAMHDSGWSSFVLRLKKAVEVMFVYQVLSIWTDV